MNVKGEFTKEPNYLDLYYIVFIITDDGLKILQRNK